MADIALVHLALDSSGVVAGEKQATRALQNVTASADKTTQTFQNMGGPIGRLASSFGNLTGNASALVGGLGLLGGAAAAAVAAITGLGAALISAAIDGGKMADEMVDLAGVTGVSVETLEGLEAGFVGLGGKATDSGRAITRFSNLMGEAATGEAPKLEKALRTLGVTDFSNVDQSLRQMLGTLSKNKDQVQTNALAMQLLGREGAKMVTVWREWDDKSSQLNATLDRFGLRVAPGVTEKAGKIGDTVDLLGLAFDNLKKKIAVELSGAITTFGETFLTTMKNLEPVILSTARLLNAMLEPLRFGIPAIRRLPGEIETVQGEKTKTITVGGQEVQVMPGKQLSIGPAGLKVEDTAVAQALKALIAEDKKKGKAPRAVTPITEFTPEQIGDPLKHWAAARERDAQDADAAWEAVQIRRSNVTTEWLELLRILSSGVEQLVPPSGSPIQQGVAGQPFPGAPIFGGLPPPSTIRTEEQARLDEQFAAIFDDMLISILTAQKTVGAAFAGLAIGVVDTFAIEFTKALRESFVTPVIRGLTDMLQSELKNLFGGLSAGGLKGVFGGIAKGIGTIFGGFFASGGTLGPGKFGVAGERGPELIFSGSQPMHIAPVTAGSAGNVFNISVGVNAPSGTVDKRTQDQLAATVMNAVKRAQRNEGAR